jgi:hypothetical protein
MIETIGRRFSVLLVVMAQRSGMLSFLPPAVDFQGDTVNMAVD